MGVGSDVLLMPISAGRSPYEAPAICACAAAANRSDMRKRLKQIIFFIIVNPLAVLFQVLVFLV